MADETTKPEAMVKEADARKLAKEMREEASSLRVAAAWLESMRISREARAALYSRAGTLDEGAACIEQDICGDMPF